MSDYFDRLTAEEIGRRVTTPTGETGTIIDGDPSTGQWFVQRDDGSTAWYTGHDLFGQS